MIVNDLTVLVTEYHSNIAAHARHLIIASRDKNCT